MRSGFCSLGLFLGRIALSAIFIMAGVGKLLDMEGTSQYMASKGMTMIPFFLFTAAGIEIMGGLSLFLGFKTRYASLILLLFLIPTTVIFHNFWAETEAATKSMQMINFLKNLGIFGGLLYVVCCGPGRFSIDAWSGDFV